MKYLRNRLHKAAKFCWIFQNSIWQCAEVSPLHRIYCIFQGIKDNMFLTTVSQMIIISRKWFEIS